MRSSNWRYWTWLGGIGLAFVGFQGLSLVKDTSAASFLAPGDRILAIDFDSSSFSDYPGGESPFNALDGDSNTKYLNFARRNSGLIVTPLAGSTTIQSFRLTTANDAPDRDPSAYALYGTNDPIVSLDNSDGQGEPWTLISQGNVTLPLTRRAVGPVVSFANATAYTSYRMVFPHLRNEPSANSMQIADMAFYQTNNGTGSSVLNFFDDARAIHLPTTESAYPGNESPALAIDNNIFSKYLNFGRERSGFIVTPAAGAKVAKSFEIYTANDAEERDPSEWTLYGTNATIVSTDNSTGDGEAWTQIDTGIIDLPLERFSPSGRILVNNTTAYTSYRMVFNSVRDGSLANSMQIGEIQFYDDIGGVNGDFNDDGLYNCDDVNALTAEIAANSTNTAFDLNSDGDIDLLDLDAWRAEAGGVNIGAGRSYLNGDANLDAVVDGSDFGIWNSNKFTSNTNWCSGNFNADTVVDGSDFGIWNSNKFTASDGALVPEPMSLGILGLAGLLFACRNARRS